MVSANLTRRALSFGAYDTVTGHPARVYTESTITGSVQNKGTGSLLGYSVGYQTSYPHTLYTSDFIREGDQVKDAFGYYYDVMSVVMDTPYLDQFDHYICGLVKNDYDDRPATSGTWHSGTTSTTDPRYRHKLYLDSYINAGNVNGDYLVMFDNIDFQMKWLFKNDLGVDTDIVVAVGKEPATAFYCKLPPHTIYAFEDTAVYNIWSTSKTSFYGANLVEQMEQEIRRIITTYPIASGYSTIRGIDTIKHTPTPLGNYNYLWNTTVIVKYKRANPDYTNSGVTITYGDSQVSTFTFPNIIDYKLLDPNTGDVYLPAGGRIGDILQIMGSSDFELNITCDLDMGDWTRAGDTVPWQVFAAIKHGGKTDANQVYQNLNIFGTAIPVRLTDFSVSESELNLTFRRYSATSGNASYKTWYGIT